MPSADWLLKAYLWATPLFIALDVLFDINLRGAAFADDSDAKWLYYGFCLVSLGFVIRKPETTSTVALTDSCLNLLLLLLSMQTPYTTWLSAAALGVMGPTPMTLEKVSNFLLVGSIGLVVFYRRLYQWKKENPDA